MSEQQADTPVQELMEAVSRPVDDTVALPPSIYKSENFLDKELDALFRQEWICVGRSDQFKEPGDYLAYQMVDQPVIVLRDAAGTLRAMSNVCLHRMSTLLEGQGHTSRIVCPYHGWTYNLDGSLRGAPLMTRDPNFDRSDYVLPEIRCEEWLGWVYITLNPDAESVHSRLAELTELIAPYQFENYAGIFHETHVWNTNWKVLSENFMESYHITVCHNGTIGPHSSLQEMLVPIGHRNFNYHWLKKEASLSLGNAHPDNTHLQGEWRQKAILMAIYPSHFITLTPGYFWYLSLQPMGVDRVHITYGGGLSPEFMADPKTDEYQSQLKSMLDEVQIEDRRCTERVYRGLNAPAARPGKTTSLERSIYDFGQYLADRIGGFERSFEDHLDRASA